MPCRPTTSSVVTSRSAPPVQSSASDTTVPAPQLQLQLQRPGLPVDTALQPRPHLLAAVAPALGERAATPAAVLPAISRTTTAARLLLSSLPAAPPKAATWVRILVYKHFQTLSDCIRQVVSPGPPCLNSSSLTSVRVASLSKV